MMEVTVDIGESDIVALNDHVARTLPSLRRQVLIVWFVSPALIGLGGAIFHNGGQPEAGTALIASAIVLFVILRPLIAVVRRRNVTRLVRSGSNLSVFGEQRISITPEEICRHNKYGHSAFYWTAVDRVEVGSEHLFVFVSTMSAIMVPKRDLNVATFEQFAKNATEYAEQRCQSEMDR